MAVALPPQRGVPRTLRGIALGTVNATLAAAAHAAAGGEAPNGAVLVLLTVAVAAIGTALADRQRGPIALLAMVGVTQLVLHLLLDVPGGHHGGQPVVLSGMTMTVAHAGAVVITATLLAGAESALFTVAAGLYRILDALLPVPRPPAVGPTSPARALVQPARVSPPATLRVLLGRVTPHRGPPLGG